MTDLEEFASNKVSLMKEKNLYRSLVETEKIEGVRIKRAGKNLISFACNDYLGMSMHPKVRAASIRALKKYSAGAGASRLITGNYPLYNDLERLIANIKEAQAACVFGSGYLANISVIPSLVGSGDLIIADKLVHACIIDGIKLSGAGFIRFTHNSLDSVANILKDRREKYNNCLIITENIFSMDGDKAPLEELYKLAEENKAWLLSDDAHGLYIKERSIGKNFIQMGTFSKAVGTYGGYVCGKKALIDYIKSSARGFMFSTALPPSIIAATKSSLQIIKDNKALSLKPIENACMFSKLLNLKEAESAIVPLIIGDSSKAVEYSKKLEEYGFYVPAIRPPTVPKGTARLRFSFSALHTKKQIEELVKIIKKEEIIK